MISRRRGTQLGSFIAVALLLVFAFGGASAATPVLSGYSSSAPTPQQPLTADFSFSPLYPVVGQTVTFTASATGGTPSYTYGWDFGDLGTGTGSPVTHPYASTGTFTVTLVVTDSLLNSTTVMHSIGVNATMSTDFTFAPAHPQVGEPVSFVATASGGFLPYSYAWTFGDTSSGSGPTPTHTYAAAKTFTVKLSVTDSASHSATASHSVSVTLALTGNFTFTPAQPQVNQTISFSTTASGGTTPYAYAWSLGDGSTASGASVTHAYSAAGTFSVTLTISDSAGHQITVTKTVTVTGALAADFSFMPALPQVGQVVFFNATASDGTAPYTFAWTFGDGKTATGAHVTHTYTSANPFTVTLTAKDSANHAATVSHIVVVSIALVADFSFSPAQPNAGQTVTFSATASGGTSPYTYAWNFGDGGVGSGVTVTHAFASAGSYTVSLTVSDSGGHIASAAKSVPVASALGADFTFTPLQPQANETVAFTGTATGGTPPYTYTWSLGDGSTASGATVSHAYVVAGTFAVTLTITDAASHQAAATKSIPVTGGLTTGFTFSPPQPAAGDIVLFSGTASGGTTPYTYTWNFGDGSTALGASASHVFAAAGSYVVNLRVTDFAGHSANASNSVAVTPPLVGDYNYSPRLPLLGESITFVANASGGTPPYAYVWNFGDGNSATGVAVSHTYATTGSYNVTLSLSDSAGHSISVRKAVVISQFLAADFTISQTFPAIGEIVSFDGVARGANSPYNFTWAFGDGSSAYGANVTHAYAAAGAFTVTLTVVDSASHTTTVSKPVIATPALTVQIAFAPALPMANETVFFSGTPAGGTPLYKFNWTFGDGSNASSAIVGHAFNRSGSFVVVVRVFDSAHHNATDSISITVSLTLVANFTFLPNGPLAHQPINFTANVTGGTSPYTLSWAFGDGGVAADFLAQYSYGAAGIFLATLTVSDSAGHVLRVSHVVAVGPGVEVGFTYSPSRPVTGRTMSFSANATGGAPPYTYRWAFGDGATGEGADTNHTYGGFGPSVTYTVVVTACDSGNRCTSSAHTLTFENLFLIAILVEGSLAALVVGSWYFARFRRSRSAQAGSE